MTGMEQNLRYIEREIRFMVKDQFGNPTYAKYADRVIEDACGIPNFCSTVLSSKRPLTAILRAVRGPRGDIIVRFFNVALHDTRIEMVMVLAEVAKLRIHNNRKSKNAHDYFMKLYRKANKRMVRLITGSKNKESFKSMYRGLRDFAKMDDFDYDDDDIDDYFDAGSEFGDSDYAEACLDAYRDGKTPPEIDLSDYYGGLNLNLKGNEEILKEIASIESKLGRHLTDAELDRLLCGDDDDDADEISFHNVDDVRKSSDKAIDDIVDVIYNRLIEKLGITDKTKVSHQYESLDEFIDREGSKVDLNPPEATTSPITSTNDISGNASTQALIGTFNRLKNGVDVAGSVTVESNEDDELTESDTDESNSLPPSDELGGKFNEADFIDVGNSDELSEYPNVNSEVIFNDDDASTNETTDEINVLDNTNSPHMQHALIANDVINDCRLADTEISNKFIDRIKNYLDRIGIKINDIFVSLVPSNADDKLFTLLTTVRVIGDCEIINMMHLNTVALMHIKNIAERFDISENMIDIEFNVVYSDDTFDSDLKILNTLNKDFKSQTVDNLYSAMSAITTYIYRRTNKIVDVRFINDPNSADINVYFFSKSDDPLGAEFEEFYRTELDGEGVLNEIIESFNINCNVNYHLDENEDEFFENVQKVIRYHIEKTPLLNKYTQSTKKIIESLIDEFEIDTETIEHVADISTGRKNVILDIIYRVFTKKELNGEQIDGICSQYDTNGEYLVQLENVIRAITMNSQVSIFVEYHEYIEDDEDVTEDDAPKTSNFGI